jgi:hypothetical protein
MKDTFIHGKLQEGNDEGLPAPRKCQITPVKEPSEPIKSPDSPIHVNLKANRMLRRIGRRSSSIISEAVADYERREAEKVKQKPAAPIQRLLRLVKRRAEGNSSLTGQFEDTELKSPVAPSKSKPVILTRSASVGRVIPAKQLTLKLLSTQQKPPPVPVVAKPPVNSLPFFLKSAIHAKSGIHPFARSIPGSWTKPVRGNSPLSMHANGLNATFSEMVMMRGAQRMEKERASGAETNLRRRKEKGDVGEGREKLLPHSKARVYD